MVLVSDGDWMVMLLVGDGVWMVMMSVGHADQMVMVLVRDGDRMPTLLVEGGDWCQGGHLGASVFLFRPRVSFISKVRGVSVLLSFISLLSNCQNQCIVHFQRAWEYCLVGCRWLSTSFCHSFQKSGSPVGFVVSACLQRLFVGLRLFRLNFLN